MRKAFLLLFVFAVAGIAAHAQSFNIKELLALKDHDVQFFHDFVKKKGYSYEKSKYDEKNENYSYVFLTNIADDLHQVQYTKKSDGVAISFGTTDVKCYEQIKNDIKLLEFKFMKYVPKQQHGRSVLMMLYTDGNTMLQLYNSYIEDEDHALVRYYKVRVY